MRGYSFAARAYILGVVLLGAALLTVSVHEVSTGQPGLWDEVVVLALLVVGAEALATTLGALVARDMTISVATPILIASFLLLGPWGAAIVGAGILLDPTPIALVKRLFNGAGAVVTVFVSGWVYVLTGGVPLLEESFSVRGTLLPMLLASLALEVVNGTLIVGVVSLAERVSPTRVWVGMMRPSVLPNLVYSLFGLMLAVVWASGVGGLSAVLVLVPLLVARWVFALFAMQREAYEATIRSLIQAVETKDLYTRGHSERVARASVMIGRRRGLREDRVESLRYAGILHDVGKLAVPTRVLQKAGRLSDEEFAAIQEHPVSGREITHDLAFLGEAVEGIYHHHERLDGRGYPLGLKGSEIPEFARIIAVADAFDSMTTTRSYRGARTLDEAIVELERCKGTQFDPVMVDALLAALAAEGWQTQQAGPEPLVALPSYGRDDDDPTTSASFEAASESPARAESDAVAEAGAALEDAMRGFEAHVEPLPGVDFGVDVDPTHHRSGSSEAR